MKTPDHTIEMSISKGHLDDQIIQFLHAAGFLQESEEVLGIEFGSNFSRDMKKESLIPLSIKLKKIKEVKLLNHNE